MNFRTAVMLKRAASAVRDTLFFIGILAVVLFHEAVTSGFFKFAAKKNPDVWLLQWLGGLS